MKNLLFDFFCLMIRFSGFSFFVSRILTKRKVKIVVYHNPKEDIFKKHIKYLSKRYNFIFMDEFVEALINKDFTKIPPNSLCVTIDDGYKENYQLLKVIKEYNVKPTIYLCSQIIDTKRHYWDKECPKNKILKLKKCTNKHRLDFLKKEIDFQETKECKDRQALNLKEIDEMKEWVDFQLHSKFHADLEMCSNIEKENEIGGCKIDLEKLLDKDCLHLAYPHGSYDDSVIDVVKISGIKSGRTIDVGFNGKNTNPYKLRVTGISDDASINKVAAQLTGVTMYLRYIFNGNFKGEFTKK